jgi:hypothetical protein
MQSVELLFIFRVFLQAQNSKEPFPTTSEDLAGFWDMVMLQVEHVNRLFEEITTLRAATWVEVNSNLIFITYFSLIYIIKGHVYLSVRWEFFAALSSVKQGVIL